MPYPESCPECRSTFRNTGTHFTARRNEVGRHVLLELGCQTTNRRFWWNFTTGQLAGQATTPAAASAEVKSATTTTTSITERLLATACAATNGASSSDARNGGARPDVLQGAGLSGGSATASRSHGSTGDSASGGQGPGLNGGSTSSTDHPLLATVPLAQQAQPEDPKPVHTAASLPRATSSPAGSTTPAEAAPQDTSRLREAFLRQLQLDRLTMRQMRTWLMIDEARRAAEVAASATEGTYERLALALFGVDLPQLLGRAAAVPPSTAMSAEERLELQREKARIRARLRRAAIKAAKQTAS